MPIGSRIGSRIGATVGARVGSSPGGDPMAGVFRDSGSLKYWPRTAGQWDTALAASSISSGGPMSLRNWQEASGNIVDQINNIDLTAFGGGGSYQQSVTGWTDTKAVVVAEGGAGGYLNNTDTDLPAPSTEAFLWVLYLRVASTPLAERTIAIMGDGNGLKLNITTSPFLKGYLGTVAGGTGVSAVPTTVIPVVIKSTAAAATVFTESEKIAVSWTAPSATKALFVGGAVELSPPLGILGDALFKGAAAAISETNIKRMLTNLGWSPLWTPA